MMRGTGPSYFACPGPVAAIRAAAGGVALTAALMGSGCKPAVSSEAAVPAEPPPLELSSVDVGYLAREGSGGRLSVSGVLVPRRQVTLKARVAGELAQLEVQEGDALRAGALVARIDPGDARMHVAERRALVDSAEAELAAASKQREAKQRLLDAGYVSQSAFDIAEANFLAKQSAKLAAQAQLTLAQTALQHTEVRTPQPGVVQGRHANSGEYLPVGAPIVTVVDPSELRLLVSVPATEIARVRVGSECHLSIVGDSNELVGRVAKLSPTPDGESRAYAVYVDVDNREGRLRIGMFARGSLATVSQSTAAVLPLEALYSESGRDYVLTVESGRIARRPVTVQRRDEARARAEVEPTIDPGTPILFVRNDSLREGKRVVLVTASR